MGAAAAAADGLGPLRRARGTAAQTSMLRWATATVVAGVLLGLAANALPATTPAATTVSEPLLSTADPGEIKHAFTALGDNLRGKNWTSVIHTMRDPRNRSYVVSSAMLCSLGLALFGHQLIRMWLFLGGFVSVAVAFYLFAPSVLPGTDVCCDPSTDKARVLISVGLGVLAGGVALWVLRVGVFLCGTCLGLGISLALRTALAHMHVFQSDVSFAMFYSAAALVGGLVALYKDKPIIIVVTAFGGAFAFFVGLGYFDQCAFVTIVTHVEAEVTSPRHPERLPRCVPPLAAGFVVLAVVGVLVQCGCAASVCASATGGGGTTGGGGGAGGRIGQAQNRRRRRRIKRELLSDDDLELKELLVKRYLKDELKRGDRDNRRAGRPGASGGSRRGGGRGTDGKRRVYRKRRADRGGAGGGSSSDS